MTDDILEQNYQNFLKVHQAKYNSTLFTLVHLKWCLENIQNLSSDIHLADSLKMALDGPDFSREKELHIMAQLLFALYWILNGHFPDDGDKYLDEIGEYGIASYKHQNDITIIVMHCFFQCGAYLVKGEHELMLNALEQMDKLTNDFGKAEDIAFSVGIRNHIHDKEKSIDIFSKRAIAFLNDHADYIERLINKTSRQVGSLNADLLESMFKAMEEGDFESINKMLKDNDDIRKI